MPGWKISLGKNFQKKRFALLSFLKMKITLTNEILMKSGVMLKMMTLLKTNYLFKEYLLKRSSLVTIMILISLIWRKTGNSTKQVLLKRFWKFYSSRKLSLNFRTRLKCATLILIQVCALYTRKVLPLCHIKKLKTEDIMTMKLMQLLNHWILQIKSKLFINAIILLRVWMQPQIQITTQLLNWTFTKFHKLKLWAMKDHMDINRNRLPRTILIYLYNNPLLITKL